MQPQRSRNIDDNLCHLWNTDDNLYNYGTQMAQAMPLAFAICANYGTQMAQAMPLAFAICANYGTQTAIYTNNGTQICNLCQLWTPIIPRP